MIAGRIRHQGELPAVCQEAIYQYIYGAAPELIRLLPRHHPKWKPKWPYRKTPERIKDRTGLEQPPKAANTRRECGHWDADMIVAGNRQYAVTDAGVHDSQVLEAVLLPPEAGREVWADSAYRSEEIEAQLKARHLRFKIHHKGSRNKALRAQHKRHNRGHSRIRARVEHVFGHQVTAMGGKLIRTIGIMRARAKIGMKNLAYNFQRFLVLTTSRKAHSLRFRIRDALICRESGDSPKHLFLSRISWRAEQPPVLPETILVFCVEGNSQAIHSYPIIQSFVDICLSGCLPVNRFLHSGDFDFSRTFLRGTLVWSTHWVNDRRQPRVFYRHSPKTRKIDALLSSELVNEFPAIKIDTQNHHC